MTKYTTYIAFDGEEFDDEDDCLAYERKLQATNFEGEIFLYNINREPIPLDIEDLDDVYFVNIETERAREWFIGRCWDCDSVHPWSECYNREEEFPLTGFFWFDTNNNTWHCWQTDIEKLNAIRDYFQLFEED